MVLQLYVCMKCHETCDGLMVVYMLNSWVVESSNFG